MLEYLKRGGEFMIQNLEHKLTQCSYFIVYSDYLKELSHSMKKEISISILKEFLCFFLAIFFLCQIISLSYSFLIVGSFLSSILIYLKEKPKIQKQRCFSFLGNKIKTELEHTDFHHFDASLYAQYIEICRNLLMDSLKKENLIKNKDFENYLKQYHLEQCFEKPNKEEKKQPLKYEPRKLVEERPQEEQLFDLLICFGFKEKQFNKFLTIIDSDIETILNLLKLHMIAGSDLYEVCEMEHPFPIINPSIKKEYEHKLSRTNSATAQRELKKWYYQKLANSFQMQLEFDRQKKLKK